MSTLLAKAKLKPEFEDFFEDIAREVFQATHDNESAMVRYEYFRGTDDRTYYVLLSFENFEGFMEHQVADYHHNVDFMDCFEEFRLEWVDPIEGASPLVQSETQGTLDDSRNDRWNQYVENHSEATPKWWLSQRSPSQ
ncbi:MAG: antibiotic biosynthesis monooxygenase [Actinomycetota bacterium]|nr:antibiotic biosynthesis monooxygenase [Actinomycetota bacterium]